MLSELVNEITGLPIESCDAFISLFVAIPIGIVYNKLFSYIANNTKIPESQQRLYRCLYIIIITIYLMFVYLSWFGIVNILISIVFTYGLIKIFKPSLKLSIVILVYSIIHLLYWYVYIYKFIIIIYITSWFLYIPFNNILYLNNNSFSFLFYL